MSDAIAALSDAMRNDAETLRVIGQNVANLETTAYRREIAVLRPSFDQVSDGARAASAPSTLSTAIDTRPGTLKSTGEGLHLALEGPGFFVVETPEGGEALTRRGDFRLDLEGRLVTHNGLTVLGDAGAIQADESAQIAPDGAVRVAGNVVGQLRIAQVAPESQLTAMGGAWGGDLYQAAQLAEADSAARVRQGFLETSNVETVQEMIRLIETMRHFESVQRFVVGYDSMMGKAITELGKV